MTDPITDEAREALIDLLQGHREVYRPGWGNPGACGCGEGTHSHSRHLAGVLITAGWTPPATKEATVSEALPSILRAWVDEGPRPEHHRAVKASLFTDWPTLARAIDRAASSAPSSPRSPSRWGCGRKRHCWESTARSASWPTGKPTKGNLK